VLTSLASWPLSLNVHQSEIIPFRLPLPAAVGLPWGRPLEAGVLPGILARSVLVGHYGVEFLGLVQAA